MPTYEYRCADCARRIELRQTLNQMRVCRDRLRCQRCEGKMEFIFPVPAISTNKTFLAGRGDGLGSDDRARKLKYAQAKANGVSTAGKVWSPQLNTWISGKDDVKRICQQRNLHCEGLVNVQGHDVQPPEQGRYQVAEDIVDQEVGRISEEHGDEMTAKQKLNLRDETRQRLSGSPDG